MDKTYDPHAIEQTWYQRWEEKAGSLGGTSLVSSPPLSLPPPHAVINARPAAAIKKFLSARFIAFSHANQPDFRTAGDAIM